MKGVSKYWQSTKTNNIKINTKNLPKCETDFMEKTYQKGCFWSKTEKLEYQHQIQDILISLTTKFLHKHATLLTEIVRNVNQLNEKKGI